MAMGMYLYNASEVVKMAELSNEQKAYVKNYGRMPKKYYELKK